MFNSDFDKKPNFFIIGAPKCGTTSLSEWLGQHENIFMCKPKEPHFFNTDSKHRSYTALTDYELLFNHAKTNQHHAIGEASVWYLISKTAIKNIFNYQPNAKIIVCLRNPIEACVSLHDQKYFSGDETVKQFSTAWELQDSRKLDPTKVPPNCVDVREILYGESCKFGALLTKLLEVIPKDNLHIVLFDDLKANPRMVYLDTLRFLNIEDDNNTNFNLANPSKRRYFVALPRIQRKITRLKHAIGFKHGTGIGNLLNKINRTPRLRETLDEETKIKLANYFREDIELTQSIINRDLGHWVAPRI